MEKDKLKDWIKTSMLAGGLAVGLSATDLTPKAWADDHDKKADGTPSAQTTATDDKKADKGEEHACGEGKCGKKDGEKKCGSGGCGEGSCG